MIYFQDAQLLIFYAYVLLPKRGENRALPSGFSQGNANKTPIYDNQSINQPHPVVNSPTRWIRGTDFMARFLSHLFGLVFEMFWDPIWTNSVI